MRAGGVVGAVLEEVSYIGKINKIIVSALLETSKPARVLNETLEKKIIR